MARVSMATIMAAIFKDRKMVVILSSRTTTSVFSDFIQASILPSQCLYEDQKKEEVCFSLRAAQCFIIALENCTLKQVFFLKKSDNTRKL